MDITEIDHDVLVLDLNVTEHRALSGAVCLLMSSIEPCDVQDVLGWSLEQANEFGYSVYLEEAAARLGAIAWLEAAGCADKYAVKTRARPVLAISFSDYGSTWHVNLRQAMFIARCVDVARRMEAAGTLVAREYEDVFDLVA